MLALAPALLSGLILVEQAVGVAGPQPLIVGGVLAGSLVLASGVLALLGANGEPASTMPALWVRLLAVAPAACAAVALALPALVAEAKVSGSVGSFSGAWTMTGIESIAALCALALALALVAGVFSPRPLWLSLVGLAACLSWPWLLAVPTHVLTTWLAPGIQSYYGTEYGTIAFTPVQNLPMYVAVAASGVGFLVLSVAASGLARRRSGALSSDHGGSQTP
jgi:hypothetical protein